MRLSGQTTLLMQNDTSDENDGQKRLIVEGKGKDMERKPTKRRQNNQNEISSAE